ncbi:Lrp/AsnC family transcriptional regulator [Candidatus Micrarchaeota archaeon]|nr:Lrp/AsnC family transcriptional regulator [Candidatus Micrarchaeota archaeon]
MTIETDNIDRKILSELAMDGRVSAKKLAKKLKMHPNTLLLRMKRLQCKGVVRGFSANIDYEKMGYSLHVCIFMKVPEERPGDAEQLNGLLEMKELEALYATTGDWDLVSLWRVQNKEHLNSLIRKISGSKIVTKILTSLVLYTYTDTFDFNPFNPEDS